MHTHMYHKHEQQMSDSKMEDVWVRRMDFLNIKLMVIILWYIFATVKYKLPL
jgi:hypothetical protein